ncbi:helix-turn-helix transcriptional regulator [Plantactinospora sp. S1510]|uniref:Helix-turn-helix transcriptional regulator n=1 Tax=Plantactinospora alkalitolerans TaxID=2789879 RepID=A0ABS0HAB7_9ACTN|nr:helix-turn-helix transcriptional regulator [Plantactinospora alkalitolerans]
MTSPSDPRPTSAPGATGSRTGRAADPVEVRLGAAVQRLYRARLAAGLSQYALAARSGVAQPVISGLESGRQPPTLTTVIRLLEGLGIDEFTI